MMQELKTRHAIAISKIKNILCSGFDLLFPMRCASCGAAISNNENGVCRNCILKIQYINNACPLCSGFLKNNTCTICSTRFMFIKQNITLAEYTGVIKDLIIALKFQRIKRIAYFLGRALSKQVDKISNDFDIITCVPMNRKKKWQRGFNQAEILARIISREKSITFKSLLKEEKQSGIQKSMGFIERFFNVIGRYYVIKKENIRGKKILIIDDVFTTGATLNECARILIENGAAEVYSMTLARVNMQH